MDALGILVEWAFHLNDLLPELLETHRWWALLLLVGVLMLETSLFPPLPGDSLIFAAGLAAAGTFVNIHIVVVTLTAAAFLGYGLSYFLGRKLSMHVLRRTGYLTPDRLAWTRAFFVRYGRSAIMVARFLPGLRTAAPLAAGVGEMPLRPFLVYSAIGGMVWVAVFAYSGYHLGGIQVIRANLFFVTLGMFALSLVPILIRLAWRAHSMRRSPLPLV